MATQKELYARIAETLIEKIRSGTAPWQKPWSAVQDAPVNGTTGKRYRGGNMMWLMAQEREDPRWMTYKQAQSIGAQVRKGEKGTPVIYWKFEEERTVKDENGQEKKVTTRLERPRSFTSTVFNAEQIDGLPPLETPEKSWEPVQRAEDILTPAVRTSNTRPETGLSTEAVKTRSSCPGRSSSILLTDIIQPRCTSWDTGPDTPAV